MSESRVKVLHVTECYAGGVSRAIDTAAAVLEEHDHFLLWAGDESPETNASFTSTVKLPNGLWRRHKAVNDAVEKIRPDLVVAHSSWAGVYTRIRRLKQPLIYEPHCYKFDDPGENFILRIFYRIAEKVLARRAHTTAVLSPHEDALAEALNPRGSRHLVPNTATVSPGTLDTSANFETGNAVAMIGRLTRQKDPIFFLDVARKVRAVLPDAQFRWIGDGDPAIRQKLELADIEVTGWLEPEELSQELSRPSLYFHSARYEGFPLSILDAASFDHPIVGREIPAFSNMPIPTASTSLGCSRLIVDALSGGSSYASAKKAAIHLNTSMSRSAQKQSLESLVTNSLRGRTPSVSEC